MLHGMRPWCVMLVTPRARRASAGGASVSHPVHMHLSPCVTLGRMTMDERVGENVHRLMWQKRIRRQPMCEALGLSPSTLSRKMRGEVAWSASDIAKAAEVLDVEPGSLFVGAREPVVRLLPHPDSNGEPAGYQMALAA